LHSRKYTTTKSKASIAKPKFRWDYGHFAFLWLRPQGVVLCNMTILLSPWIRPQGAGLCNIQRLEKAFLWIYCVKKCEVWKE